MNRRNFLKTSAAAFGSSFFAVPGCNGLFTGKGPIILDRLGIQLYTLRSVMQEEFEGTIEQVADIGYKEVEFAGYYDRSPQQVRNLLDRTGLSAPAAHISLEAVRQDLNQLIESSRVIGHKYLVVPNLPRSERDSADNYRRIADFFNHAGEKCKESGIKFAYHNHAFEFDLTDGEIPYDILLEHTDPELVTMELDLFWIIRGEHDPLDYFARYPGRFELCHVKDMDAEGEMVDVGQGEIDFAAIFAQSEQAGLKHYIVEHDNPDHPLETAVNSFNYLNQLEI